MTSGGDSQLATWSLCWINKIHQVHLLFQLVGTQQRGNLRENSGSAYTPHQRFEFLTPGSYDTICFNEYHDGLNESYPPVADTDDEIVIISTNNHENDPDIVNTTVQIEDNDNAIDDLLARINQCNQDADELAKQC